MSERARSWLDHMLPSWQAVAVRQAAYERLDDLDALRSTFRWALIPAHMMRCFLNQHERQSL